jgi:hypothetical protein
MAYLACKGLGLLDEVRFQAHTIHNIKLEVKLDIYAVNN